MSLPSVFVDVLRTAQRLGHGLMRVTFWSMAAVLSLTLGAWLIVQWGILPQLDRWRTPLEQKASAALGLQVRIGHLGVLGDVWAPVIILRDLQLLDAQAQPVLQLNKVEAVITPGSIWPSVWPSRWPTSWQHWKDHWRWEPGVKRLHIEALQLALRRDRQGRIFLAGLPLTPSDTPAAPDHPGDNRIADWLASQPELVLQGASVSWEDEQRAAPVLVLSGVDIDLHNRFGQHTLRLSAVPPEGWGKRFFVSADMQSPWLSWSALQHPGDWQRWTGTLQADWPLVDISPLRRYIDLPVDLTEGRGRLSTRLSISAGSLTGATADLQLQAVTLRLAQHLPPLSLHQIEGELSVQHDTQSTRLQAHRLSFQLPPLKPSSTPNTTTPHTHPADEAAQWPATDLELVLKGPSGHWQGGALLMSWIDLELLSHSAAHVPLAGHMRRLLAQTQPQGQLQDVRYTWEGSLEAPTHWQAQGRAQALSLTAAPATQDLISTATPGRPGFSGADVHFEASERGGKAHLRMAKGGQLEFPGVFEEPRVSLERLQADVRWSLQPHRDGGRPDIRVDVLNAAFATPDGQGQLQGHWRTGARRENTFGRGAWLPGVIDLQAKIDHLRADRVHRYLPLGIASSVRQYVRDAVQGGTARQVTARVRGEVLDFPFAEPEQGDFHIAGQVEHVRLDAIPGTRWPAYTDVHGTLIFDRQSMTLQQAHGRFGDTGSGSLHLQDVSGGMADFVHDPVLRLSGRVQGNTRDALRYLTDSPVDGWLNHAFAPAHAPEGQAALSLTLAVPVLAPERSTVLGQLDLHNTELQMRPDTPALSAVDAHMTFTESGFELPKGRASVAGGTLDFQGRLDPDGGLRFRGKGHATVAGLRGVSELGAITDIARHVNGEADYQLALDLLAHGTVVQVNSDLVGVWGDVPAPLHKLATDPLPLHVRLEPQAAPTTTSTAPNTNASTATAEAELLSVQLGSVFNAQYWRERQAPGRVQRGRLSVGSVPLPAWPTTGVVAELKLSQLSIDAWRTWLEQHLLTPTPTPASTPPNTGTAAAPVTQATTAALTDPVLDSYLPHALSLAVDELTAHGRPFHQVQATLTHAAATPHRWDSQIQARELAGQVEVHMATTRTPALIKAHLQHLSLQRSPASTTATAVPPPRPASTNTQPPPGLDIQVDQLTLAGRPLGRFELLAGPQPGTPAKTSPNTDPNASNDWRITRLRLERPEAQLDAVGLWSPPAQTPDHQGLTRLTFRLDLRDSGELLKQLGWPGMLIGGQGHLGGQLQWPGALPDFATAHLDGTLNISLDSGQFLQADPGAGRLLGVLSLQSLPRRFLLDFRDVFQQGFSFDRVDGDVHIDNGLANTHNLRIRGVQAMILTEGSASLVHETQNLRVWVVPDLNAGMASLAYAVINPAVGLGTLVTQLFLQGPLSDAATREFQITGGWAAPQVQPVDRRQDARPRPDAAATATSATPTREPSTP